MSALDSLVPLVERFVVAFEKQSTKQLEPRDIDIKDDPKTPDGMRFRYKLQSGLGWIREVIYPEGYLEIWIVDHQNNSKLLFTTKEQTNDNQD